MRGGCTGRRAQDQDRDQGSLQGRGQLKGSLKSHRAGRHPGFRTCPGSERLQARRLTWLPACNPGVNPRPKSGEWARAGAVIGRPRTEEEHGTAFCFREPELAFLTTAARWALRSGHSRGAGTPQGHTAGHGPGAMFAEMHPHPKVPPPLPVTAPSPKGRRVSPLLLTLAGHLAVQRAPTVCMAGASSPSSTGCLRHALIYTRSNTLTDTFTCTLTHTCSHATLTLHTHTSTHHSLVYYTHYTHTSTHYALICHTHIHTHALYTRTHVLYTLTCTTHRHAHTLHTPVHTLHTPHTHTFTHNTHIHTHALHTPTHTMTHSQTHPHLRGAAGERQLQVRSGALSVGLSR